jgi:DNA-binding NarL/FixJ family response regulator
MGVGTENRDRRAVIVASRGAMFEPLVDAAGFEVVGMADTAVNGEHLLRHLEPDVVVLENDLLGSSGWESIPALRAASPATQVLLVVTEDWTPRDMGSTGAFAVVTRSRLGELVTELAGVDVWIAGQVATTVGDDRRTGRDRRLHQDWAKVGWERRDGERRAFAA